MTINQFPQGRYYGTHAFERRVDDISLCHLRATVPEHEVQEHSHAGAHIVLSTRGRYLSSAFGEQREGPTLVYNPPGVVHRDRFAGDDGWFFAMSFHIEDFGDTSEQMALPSFALRSHDVHAMRLAFSMLRVATSNDTVRMDIEVACMSLLDSFCKPSSSLQKLPPWLQQAQEMIADMSEYDLSIADIADAVGVHRVYLARQYQRHLGRSPGSDLRHRRIERATHMLMTSEIALCDIAAACGYCDQSHLNRSFLQHWQLTPSEFRTLSISEIGFKYPRLNEGRGLT